MANSHPYISGPGNISEMISKLRNQFPATVDASTVKKFSLAPNNESYVINALQFVGIIDEENKKTEKGASALNQNKDEDFAKAFGEMVTDAYSELFELYGDAAWTLQKDDLISFFRQTDGTSSTIGARQASTFQMFAALCGHGELPPKKQPSNATKKDKTTKSKKPAQNAPAAVTKSPSPPTPPQSFQSREFGLSVKIDINLPAGGTKETYDNIFKSIRENLMDD